MKNSVNFERLGHAIVVPVRVDGTDDVQFILDTGIGINLISKSYCEELKCEAFGSYSAKRMSGQEVSVELSRIKSLRIANIELNDVVVGVFDMSKFPKDFEKIKGFLSLNHFLSNPFTFDYRNKVIRIEDEKSLKEIVLKGNSEPLHFMKDDYKLDVSISMRLPNGRDVDVEVDTGSSSLILDERYMDELGISKNSENVEIKEGKDETGNTYLRYFSELKGNISPTHAPSATHLNPRVMFQKIIYDGLIGDKFLSSFSSVTYDLPGKKLIFIK